MKIIGIILSITGIGLIIAGIAVNGFLNPNLFWLIYDFGIGGAVIYTGFITYKFDSI